MIIIAGHELVNATNRDRHVDAFRALVSKARQFDGCIQFAITADSVEPERINTFEIWRDTESLNNWRKQARGPRTGKPRYSDVRQYDASETGSLS